MVKAEVTVFEEKTLEDLVRRIEESKADKGYKERDRKQTAWKETDEPLGFEKGGSCHCRSFNCRGDVRSRSTLKRHADADFKLLMEQQPESESETLVTGVPYYPELYQSNQSANTPLYEGASISVLDHLFLEMRKFVSHPHHSKVTVSENFRYDKMFKLPKPNNCCSSYDEAKGLLKEFLVPLRTYDACPNDCMLYRNETQYLDKCLKCDAPRFANKKARKVFKYLPITPRITRLYQDENLAKILQAHSARPENGFIQDIWDTNRWKEEWFGRDGEMKGQDSGCALSFCSDGVNPFKTMHLIYSMWPLMLSVLNFPIALRKSVGGIILVGIIPGNGRKEAYNLEPYLSLIVEELLTLSECHIYYPPYMAAPVEIKVKLLQYVLDFPAIGKVLHQPGSTANMACPFCGIVGCYLHSLKKNVYVENRRYLEEDDLLRQCPTFQNKEQRDKPSSLTVEEESAKRKAFEELPNNNQKKKFTKANGVKGVYCFMDLPYHKFHLHYQPDAMHTITDAVQNVIGWLIGYTDGKRLQDAENELGCVKKRHMPAKSVMLTKEEIKVGNDRCKSLVFPKDFSGFSGDVFSSPKITLKNTHGWTEYTANRIWAYLLKDSLPVQQRRSLTIFFDVLCDMHAKKFTSESWEKLTKEMNIALALLERDATCNIFNITTHALRHIAEKIKDNGPVYSSWMYPFERMNSWITRRAMNRSKTEECIMETVQIMDWVIFSQFLGKFKHLQDKDNSITEAIDRAFEREGIITEERVGTPVCLGPRQIRDINPQKKNLDAVSHKQLDSKAQLMADDFVYRVGDICYIEAPKTFGKIIDLVVVGTGERWIDMEVFSNPEQDFETGIFFSKVTCDRPKKMFKMDDVSPPLVTALNGEFVWFVSHKSENPLPWLREHLQR